MATMKPVSAMYKRLDAPDNPKWDRTTEQENFLWVAVIVAHQNQLLKNRDPIIGFYGAVQNGKEFQILSRNIKKWFKETHNIENIPIYKMQLSWQRPHLLTLDHKKMVDPVYLEREIREIIAWSYKKAARSNLDMTLRQQADRTKDPKLIKAFQRKTFRTLIDPTKKMPAWKAAYMKELKEEQEAQKAKEAKERAEVAAELAKMQQRFKNVAVVDENAPVSDEEGEEYDDDEGETETTTLPYNKEPIAEGNQRPYNVPMDVRKAWGVSSQSVLSMCSIMSNKGELLFYLNAVYDDDAEKTKQHIETQLMPRIDGHVVCRAYPMFSMINMAGVECAVDVKDVYGDKHLNEAFDPSTAGKDLAAPPAL